MQYFCSWFKPFTELDCKLVQRRFPVVDRHGPAPENITDCQIKQFEHRVVMP
jgi:hypothetical protein